MNEPNVMPDVTKLLTGTEVTLQEAFDAGFEAVKGYVDRGFAAVEERLSQLEAARPIAGERRKPARMVVKGVVEGDVSDRPPAPIQTPLEKSNEALARLRAWHDDLGEKLRTCSREVLLNGDGDAMYAAQGLINQEIQAEQQRRIQLLTGIVEDSVPKAAIAPGPAPAFSLQALQGLKFWENFGKEIGKFVRQSTAPLLEATEEITRRLEQLEQRTSEPDAINHCFDPLTRTLELKFIYGDTAMVLPIDDLPIMIFRGAFQDGRTYKCGDVVQHSGHIWHANAPTSERPGEGVTLWTLMVRRGRDGKSIDPATAPPIGGAR